MAVAWSMPTILSSGECITSRALPEVVQSRCFRLRLEVGHERLLHLEGAAADL